jgi:hypothetical protein
MYKILGVYVFNVYPFPVANILTADNNDARKPPTISYMWALAASEGNDTKTKLPIALYDIYRHLDPLMTSNM